jgi:phytoene synthase
MSEVVPRREDDGSGAATSGDGPNAHRASHAHVADDGVRIAHRVGRAGGASLGIALDGGHVIDFGSVKDSSSRAEVALANARRRNRTASMLPHGVGGTSGDDGGGGGGRLMGINDDVVSEVGYEIGNFVNEYVDSSGKGTANDLVQECARYLRSRAGMGTFKDRSRGEDDDDDGAISSMSMSSSSSFTAEEISRYDRLLARAYEESGIVTSAFAKTFYLGTRVLPEPAMRAIWAIYVWCRRTDEIVDAPRPDARDPNDEMLTDLSAWEMRLENLFDHGDVVDALDLPLLDCKIRFPKLPITPFSDMIRGMLMDIPGLGQERYDTWDELHLYCYRVAGTVGLMSMPVFGCAPGYTDEMAK